jgi:hypothetical protein
MKDELISLSEAHNMFPFASKCLKVYFFSILDFRFGIMNGKMFNIQEIEYSSSISNPNNRQSIQNLIALYTKQKITIKNKTIHGILDPSAFFLFLKAIRATSSI